MRRTVLFFIGTIFVLAGGGPVAGDVRAARDPRDTKGPLDVRRIEHGHGAGSRLRHTITGHRAWGRRDLRCGGRRCHGLFNIDISTDRDRDTERLIQIYARNGRYRAPVLKRSFDCLVRDALCVEQSRRIGRARVVRPSSRSLAFSFSDDLLGRRVKSYRWRVTLAFGRRRPCPEDSSEAPKFAGGYVCIDYAPQRYGSDTPGWLRHRL